MCVVVHPVREAVINFQCKKIVAQAMYTPILPVHGRFGSSFTRPTPVLKALAGAVTAFEYAGG